MKRLEDAGLGRSQVEAIAFEINDSTSDLVTTQALEDALEAAINKGVIKSGVLTAAIIGLACTIMSLVLSLK